MAAPNPTQKKIIDVAAKYGYKVDTCYARKFDKSGKVVHYLGLWPIDRLNPKVYFKEQQFGSEKTGLDRFEINHSAYGSMSIQDEEEFISKVQDAIQMCKELNEIDLDGLPVDMGIEDSVDYPRRAKIQKIFSKV